MGRNPTRISDFARVSVRGSSPNQRQGFSIPTGSYHWLGTWCVCRWRDESEIRMPARHMPEYSRESHFDFAYLLVDMSSMTRSGVRVNRICTREHIICRWVEDRRSRVSGRRTMWLAGVQPEIKVLPEIPQG